MAKQPSESPETKPSVIAANTVIEVTIPWTEAESHYTTAIRQLAKRMKLKGFRQGGVPVAVAEKTLDSEEIITRALDPIIGKYYAQALEKSGHKPLTQPRLSLVAGKKGSDWVVSAEIATKPELIVKDYKKAVQEAHKAAEKEYESTQKKAVEKKEKSTEKTSEKELTVEQKEQQKRQSVLQGIYRALLEKFQPQVPELLVHQEMQYELEQLIKQLKMFNMQLSDYLTRRNQTEDDLSLELASSVVPRIQLTFIIDAVATEQKVSVSEKEVDEYLEKNTSEEVRAKYEKDVQYRQMIQDTLTRQKVADYLLAL